MPLVCRGTQRQGSLPILRPGGGVGGGGGCSDLTMGIVGRQCVVFSQISHRIIMELTGGGTFIFQLRR